MNTPIKREDIRKGDRVRRVIEFTANSDGDAFAAGVGAFELIERPVQLPDVPGHYADKWDEWVYLAADGTWTDSSEYDLDAQVIASRAPFTLLRPVADVAAEVLAEVRETILKGACIDASEFGNGGINIPLTRNIAAIAAKFGVTK